MGGRGIFPLFPSAEYLKCFQDTASFCEQNNLLSNQLEYWLFFFFSSNRKRLTSPIGFQRMKADLFYVLEMGAFKRGIE